MPRVSYSVRESLLHTLRTVFNQVWRCLCPRRSLCTLILKFGAQQIHFPHTILWSSSRSINFFATLRYLWIFKKEKFRGIIFIFIIKCRSRFLRRFRPNLRVYFRNVLRTRSLFLGHITYRLDLTSSSSKERVRSDLRRIKNRAAMGVLSFPSRTGILFHSEKLRKVQEDGRTVGNYVCTERWMRNSPRSNFFFCWAYNHLIQILRGRW